jgi:hypothetical protein
VGNIQFLKLTQKAERDAEKIHPDLFAEVGENRWRIGDGT